MPGTCTSSTPKSVTPKPFAGARSSASSPEQPSTNKPRAPSAAVEGAGGVRSNSAPDRRTLMGQYHHPVCIEAEEGLSPHGMDSGLKEGEQGFSRPSTPNAIVALVCARGGNMPADCSHSPLIGRWAGKRVLVQGDYAEDDDIPGWQGPPLSLLHHSMDSQEERDDMTEHRETLIAEGMKGVKLPDWSSPIYADISREVRDFLEGVCNVRYFEQVQE